MSGFQFDRIVAVGYVNKQNINATAFTKRQYIESGRVNLLWYLSCEKITGVRFEKGDMSLKKTYSTHIDKRSAQGAH